MKYPVFALLALCLFSLSNCKNSSSNGADVNTGVNTSTESVVSTEAPASDPTALNQQILLDLVAGRTLSKTYAPANEETFELIKSMKMSMASQSEADRAKIATLVSGAMGFYQTYQAHRGYTDQLDSLTVYLKRGTVSLENIQKDYLSTRDQMKEAGSKLKGEQENMKAAKSEWERQFPGLGQKQQ